MSQSSRAQSAAISELRRLIEIEIEAELTHKAAKGSTYIGLIESGIPANVAWQRIASHPRLIELERAYLIARAERLCQYLSIIDGSRSVVPFLGLDGEADDG